jgi:hypothetical protein
MSYASLGSHVRNTLRILEEDIRMLKNNAACSLPAQAKHLEMAVALLEGARHSTIAACDELDAAVPRLKPGWYVKCDRTSTVSCGGGNAWKAFGPFETKQLAQTALPGVTQILTAEIDPQHTLLTVWVSQEGSTSGETTYIPVSLEELASLAKGQTSALGNVLAACGGAK